MNINLNLIQSSPRPVRSSWDEDKMNELAQSIREQGVIVPVKVRPSFDLPSCRWHGTDWVSGFQSPPNVEEPCALCSEFRDRYGIFEDWEREDWQPQWHDGKDVAEWIAAARETYGAIFELVYGHRRVEAAKRAGLTEIPAIVDSIDDTATLIQALIENVQREDMEPMDLAHALKALKDETGWSQAEMGRRGILSRATINSTMALLNEPTEIQAIVTSAPSRRTPAGHITPEHVAKVRGSVLPVTGRVAVLQKAAEEGLTVKETHRVAEAVRDAPNETVKRALLDTPVRRDVDYWKEAGSIAASDREQQRAETYAMAPAVKDFLEIIKISRRILERGKDSMNMGKMGPEHMPYIAKRLRKHADWLVAWADELDKRREEIVNG